MTSPDMRLTIASAVALAMKEFTGGSGRSVKVRQTETTSGCPIVKLTLPATGDIYNLTITKARKR